MVYLQFWDFDRTNRSFVLYFSDGHRRVYPNVEALLGAEEAYLRRIREIGTPLAAISNETNHLMSVLNQRFDDDDDDDDEGGVARFLVSWFYVDGYDCMAINYSDGSMLRYERQQIQEMTSVDLLQSIVNNMPTNRFRTPACIAWEQMVKDRLDTVLDEKEAGGDGGSGGGSGGSGGYSSG